MIRLSIVEHLSFQKNIPGKSGQPFNLAKIAIFCVADNILIIKEIAIFVVRLLRPRKPLFFSLSYS